MIGSEVERTANSASQLCTSRAASELARMMRLVASPAREIYPAGTNAVSVSELVIMLQPPITLIITITTLVITITTLMTLVTTLITLVIT